VPRFHFHLRALGRINRDPEGTELPDLTAARSYAAVVTEELMRNSGGGTRHWSMCVEDASGEPQFDLFFADVDPSLAACSPQLRMLVSKTCRRFGALTDVLCAARATGVETGMLLARAKGKPQLVYSSGR
jgi:Domain of unknown function (DUF6894)